MLCLLGLVCLFAGVTPAPALESPLAARPASAGVPLVALGAVGDTLDGQVGSITKSVIRELRRSWFTITWIYRRASDFWGYWLRRALFPIGVVIVAALADGSLLNAFRLEGVRALATYVPLMLYVYGRLLFSAGVGLLPKLLLLGAVCYGAVRRDLLPDRSMVPGRIEDVLLIVIATRAFVYACPEALIEHYAQRAVNLRSRLTRSEERAR